MKRLCERHFPAVDSLQFNYEHTGEKPCAPLVRFTAAAYTAFSSNLRELTITIETPQRLGLCLPAVGSLSPLPRLETMRLSFWAVPAHQVQSLAKVRMRQIVRLYTTPSLRTLEIRSKFYAIPWEFPMDSFLPSVESLGSLQTFSFWLPDDADYAPTYRGPRELLAFIRSQLATLVQVAIHGSPLIDNEFEHNPPTFRPDAALSFRVREEENWVARAPGRLRSSVLELEYFEYRGDWWPFGRLENLHVLNVHLFEIRLSLFVQLAEQLLRLTSLRLEYCNQYSQQMLHCMSLDIEAAGEGAFSISIALNLSPVSIHRHQSRSSALGPARLDNFTDAVYSSDFESLPAADVSRG